MSALLAMAEHPIVRSFLLGGFWALGAGKEKMQMRKMAACAGGLAVVGLSSMASASTLVNFKPTPVSPTIPEFVFNGPAFGPTLQSGPGAMATQTACFRRPTRRRAGSTPIRRSSFRVFRVRRSTRSLARPLSSILRSFSPVWREMPRQSTLAARSSSRSDPDRSNCSAPILMAPGRFSHSCCFKGRSAVRRSSAPTGAGRAVLNSSGINYTGGLIFNALVAAGGNPNNNDMSISMTDVSPTFGIDAVDGMLKDFTANATGLFAVQSVPEPTAIGALGFAAIAAFRRRRSR